MNMTRFVHSHQKERHDEADSSPLETPDGQFKHPGQTLTREPRRSRTGCYAPSLARTGPPRAKVPLLPAKAGFRLPTSACEFPTYGVGEGAVSSEGDGEGSVSGSSCFWASGSSFF
jgi:hypothetical protein